MVVVYVGMLCLAIWAVVTLTLVLDLRDERQERRLITRERNLYASATDKLAAQNIELRRRLKEAEAKI